MSAPNTTPGPWAVRRTKKREVHAGGKFICTALLNNGPPKGNVKLVEEAFANAHLIAAAPELYEALIEAAEFIQPFNRAEGLLDRIDAALAKARGAA